VKRFILLPAIRSDFRVSLGAYARAVRAAISSPTVEFKHGLETWWPTTGAEIRSQFRRAMHERISAGRSYSERGL
jgi:hypothetical protein